MELLWSHPASTKVRGFPASEIVSVNQQVLNGVAYYFTLSGEKVRNVPIYMVNGRKPTNVFDDEPEDPCSKDFSTLHLLVLVDFPQCFCGFAPYMDTHMGFI